MKDLLLGGRYFFYIAVITEESQFAMAFGRSSVGATRLSVFQIRLADSGQMR
jgi:hypothetical protein